MGNNLIDGFKPHMKPVAPPVFKRYSKNQLQDIIENNYGVVTLCCAKLDCTFSQFYKAIDYYGLREFLGESKKRLVGIAENAILECLSSQNEQIKLRAAELTLKSLGKNDGWGTEGTTINQQINISDKDTDIKTIFGIS